MSDSFRVSPKGAFSCEWNKGLDRNAFCAFRLVSSIKALFKSLLFEYTVCQQEVYNNFIKEDSAHHNSFFGKEYRRLMEIKISLEGPSSDAMKRVDRVVAARVLADMVEQLIQDGDFENACKYLSEGHIGYLNKKECCRLFKKACAFDKECTLEQRLIVSRLLLTGNCDKLTNLLGDGKEFPLFFFARDELILGLQYVLKHGDFDINEKDADGNTFLMFLAKDGEPECLEMLLGAGADFTVRNEKGSMALHFAAHDNRVQCVRKLVFNGIGLINALDHNQLTPLHTACMNGSKESIVVLVGSKGIMLNAVDNTGCTPLHHTAHIGNVLCTDVLLGQQNILVDAKDRNGNTPLHHAACWIKSKDCLESLLKAGANIDEKNVFGNTPLECAQCLSNNEECIKFLEEAVNKNKIK